MEEEKLGMEEKLSKVAEVLLLEPPSDARQLLALLDLSESLLSDVDPSPPPSVLAALDPLRNRLLDASLSQHRDVDVRIAAACCVCQIIRIAAPTAPYQGEQMKGVIRMFVDAFGGLDDVHSLSYPRRILILRTMASAGIHNMMLDLKCDELILQMFRHFFTTISERNARDVMPEMEVIATNILEQIEDFHLDLLSCLLASINRDTKEVSRTLGEKVIGNCIEKLKPHLLQAIESVGGSLNDYSGVINSIDQDHLSTLENSGYTSGMEVKQPGEGIVGYRVEVWWPDDARFYPGVIASFNPVTEKHTILYDDGDVEILLLKNEHWKFTGSRNSNQIPSDMEGILLSPNLLQSMEQSDENVVGYNAETCCPDEINIGARNVFREVCAEQVRKGCYYAWDEIGKEFASRMGYSLPKDKLKRIWDEMRREYKEWIILKSFGARLGWDDVKNTIRADEVWWRNHIKRRPKARKFQSHSLEFEEDYRIMFSKSVSVKSSFEGMHLRNPSGSQSWVDDGILVGRTSPRVEPIGRKKVNKKRKQQSKEEMASSINGSLKEECKSYQAKPESHQSALEKEMGLVQLLLWEAGLERASALKYFAMSHLIDAARRAMFKSMAPEERLGWLQFEYENIHK